MPRGETALPDGVDVGGLEAPRCPSRAGARACAWACASSSSPTPSCVQLLHPAALPAGSVGGWSAPPGTRPLRDRLLPAGAATPAARPAPAAGPAAPAAPALAAGPAPGPAPASARVGALLGHRPLCPSSSCTQATPVTRA